MKWSIKNYGQRLQMSIHILVICRVILRQETERNKLRPNCIEPDESGECIVCALIS